MFNVGLKRNLLRVFAPVIDFFLLSEMTRDLANCVWNNIIRSCAKDIEYVVG